MTNQVKQRFLLQKEDGICNRSHVRAVLKAVRGLKDGRYEVNIFKYYKQRTDRQNKFYFGNYLQSEIDCFKEYWGETYTKEQMHEFNKINFFGTEQMLQTGEIVKIPESSTKQTTISWEEKLEKGRQWFRQQFTWELPIPNEQTDLNF